MALFFSFLFFWCLIVVHNGEVLMAFLSVFKGALEVRGSENSVGENGLLTPS